MWRVPNADRAAMKKATAIGILCLVMLQFSLTAGSKGPKINVAYQRPVKTNIRIGQSQGKPIHAVDDAFEKETCFENSKKIKAPWLQIDLGKQLWVEKVRIMSKEALSNIDIRIGNRDNDFTCNPLCLKSVLIRRAPTLFSCAEPMLGRYVYIVAKGYIKLCDVQVFLNADATDTNIKYLAGTDSQDKGMLKKGKYDFEDLSPGDYAQIVLPHRKLRVKRKDLVIDLPPKTDSLTVNTAVLIPVQRNEDSSKDKCGSRQGELEQKYVNGAVMMVQDSGVVTIKALYTTWLNKKRRHTFRCSRSDVRVKGDICQLQNKCGDSYGSKCDTKFISPLLPPGSYYCKCNPGFVSSSSTVLPIANYVAPGEKCINGRPEIWHSKQNLALLKKAIASSTDKGLAKFVVDGDPGTCFMSHTGKKPWLILYLGDFQPVSLVRIHSAKSQGNKNRMKDVGVFAGMRTPGIVVFLNDKTFL
ncbi:uncharacterized protein LOC111340027 [Stylophora pistillata]|uniref:uncharacterized protein LOC111340027 n=1 Tax=Stylophora pistillata TaxID=50429 RepID=UPI000C054579|nr:uncharacterized protein LOC111340027 [Stylophora pistillata]